ncbi:MAG: hypothetical protein IJK42_01390 [Prevotella sp.]|nr:hypothetical protein [Prevotella sp.]
MAEIKDIIHRESTNTHEVHLYKEGVFLVAYERSCYAFQRYIHKYQIKCRYVKKVSDYVVSLGFPASSKESVLDGREWKDEGAYIALRLCGDEAIEEEEFRKWKASVPMEQRPASQALSPQCGNGMEDIIMQIRRFPLETKTPMDCMLFLVKLKESCNSIIP